MDTWGGRAFEISDFGCEGYEYAFAFARGTFRLGLERLAGPEIRAYAFAKGWLKVILQ